MYGWGFLSNRFRDFCFSDCVRRIFEESKEAEKLRAHFSLYTADIILRFIFDQKLLWLNYINNHNEIVEKEFNLPNKYKITVITHQSIGRATAELVSMQHHLKENHQKFCEVCNEKTGILWTKGLPPGTRINQPFDLTLLGVSEMCRHFVQYICFQDSDNQYSLQPVNGSPAVPVNKQFRITKCFDLWFSNLFTISNSRFSKSLYKFYLFTFAKSSESFYVKVSWYHATFVMRQHDHGLLITLSIVHS